MCIDVSHRWRRSQNHHSPARVSAKLSFQGVPISVISINGITLQPGELLQFIQLIDQAGCRRAVISTRNNDAYAFLLASELPLKPLTLCHLWSLDIQNGCMNETEWSTLLPLVTIPNLQQLSLWGNFMGISLTWFLFHHPCIMEIESHVHHSSSMQSSTMPQIFLDMHDLKSIDGPLSHILIILKSLSSVPHALEVSTGPEQHETYFDYILDILDIAGLCNPTAKIQVWIPSCCHQNQWTALTEAQTHTLWDVNASELHTVEFILPPISDDDILVCIIISLYLHSFGCWY